MATRRRKRTGRKPVRRRVTRRVRRRRTSPKRKKRSVKRKRSLLYSINTCSGSGYYLKVSRNRLTLSKAGKGLRCKCKSSSRAKCHSKK